MFELIFSDFWRTSCLSKPRNVSFTSPLSFLDFICKSRQVRSEPEKIKAVAEWPIPENRNQLQYLLGFANFNRLFIRKYSQKVLHLLSLTTSLKHTEWTSEASTAFQKISKYFISVPIICYPDPKKQLILKVDTSDTGVGAVLH